MYFVTKLYNSHYKRIEWGLLILTELTRAILGDSDVVEFLPHEMVSIQERLNAF